MRIPLLLATTAGLFLTATPPTAPEAHASTASYCGGALVAGLSLCVTWEMRISEYRALIARTNAGDRDAALTLAQFDDYRAFTNRGVPDGRKWWERAAQLGECQALRWMHAGAARNGNTSATAHWRKQIDRYRCTVQVDSERWMGGPWVLGKQ